MSSNRLLWLYKYSNEELTEKLLTGSNTKKYKVIFESAKLDMVNEKISDAVIDYVKNITRNKPININHFNAIKGIITSRSLTHLKSINLTMYMPILNKTPTITAENYLKTGRVYLMIGSNIEDIRDGN